MIKSEIPQEAERLLKAVVGLRFDFLELMLREEDENKKMAMRAAIAKFDAEVRFPDGLEP